MMYNATRAVIIVTAYLIIYAVLLGIKAEEHLLSVLFMCSPFLVALDGLYCPER